MIHNSFDFSLAETSMLASNLHDGQNPSWINLQSLKDVIRIQSDRKGSSNLDDHCE